MRFLNNEKGFTIIETMVALFIFTVGILALNKLQIIAIQGNGDANGLTAASSWAAGEVENILRLDYNDPLLADDGDGVNPDGDGTGQDGDNDGDDDDGGDFGLNDNTTTTADGFRVSPDGNYTIYWNVAPEEPTRNVMTIRVIATRNFFGLMQRQVALDYYKINTF